MILVLGAGLAGLSASYHLGHERCLVLEKNLHLHGHVCTDQREGFTWDQGPHVSFTKHEYVRQLFAEGCGGDFDEYEVKTSNYFRGHWIDHPAQTSLHQIPEPLRSRCLKDFLESRAQAEAISSAPTDYGDWLERAFGRVFASTFPAPYTRKYWTREPRDLTTDWVGGRIFLPKVDDVMAGAHGPLGRSTHYITKVRYPRRGGYQSFVRKIADCAQVRFGSEVVRIDLSARRVHTAAGESFDYDRLINTLPLPVFIALCANIPASVRDAAAALSCSQLLLVNVTAPHPTMRAENWMYVYDEDKHSTRINCTEKLTLGNAPVGHTGAQAEVYFSRHRPLTESPHNIGKLVERELVDMGLIDADCWDSGKVKHHLVYSPWANVIFDHDTKPALDVIWSWLESYGLAREDDDLHPLTDWGSKLVSTPGAIAMSGRFGQWKYYWTDDCVLRGRCV